MYNSWQHEHLRFRRRFRGYLAFMEPNAPRKPQGAGDQNGTAEENEEEGRRCFM
jgi:hypothetical protein